MEPPTCPNCNSDEVIPIVYGYIAPNEVGDEECYYGGCCVTGDGPEWYCKECENKFNIQL